MRRFLLVLLASIVENIACSYTTTVDTFRSSCGSTNFARMTIELVEFKAMLLKAVSAAHTGKSGPRVEVTSDCVNLLYFPYTLLTKKKSMLYSKKVNAKK